MGEDPGAVGTRAQEERRTPPQPPADAAQLRAEIERTRQNVGDIVAALAEKTDVRARAKDKVSGVRHNVNEKRAALVGKAREASPDAARSAAVRVRAKAEDKPAPAAAVAAFVGGILIGRLIKRG